MRIAGTSRLLRPCGPTVAGLWDAPGLPGFGFRSAGRLRWSFPKPIDLDSEASVSVRGSIRMDSMRRYPPGPAAKQLGHRAAQYRPADAAALGRGGDAGRRRAAQGGQRGARTRQHRNHRRHLRPRRPGRVTRRLGPTLGGPRMTNGVRKWCANRAGQLGGAVPRRLRNRPLTSTFDWWEQPDSNGRPLVCKTSALTN